MRNNITVEQLHNWVPFRTCSSFSPSDSATTPPTSLLLAGVGGDNFFVFSLIGLAVLSHHSGQTVKVKLTPRRGIETNLCFTRIRIKNLARFPFRGVGGSPLIQYPNIFTFFKLFWYFQHFHNNHKMWSAPGQVHVEVALGEVFYTATTSFIFLTKITFTDESLSWPRQIPSPITWWTSKTIYFQIIC